MFPEQLKKILRIIKRTKDKAIIFDSAVPDDSYVLMDLDNYSDLVFKDGENIEKKLAPTSKIINQGSLSSESSKSEIISLNSDDARFKTVADSSEIIKSESLTEEDLTDKINREISMWKNGEDSPFISEENKPRPAWKIPSQVKDKAQEVKD